MHGGADTDVATYEGVRADYIVTQDYSVVTVASISDPDDVDTLINIESIEFTDEVLSIVYDGNLDKIATLYEAMFDRQADVGGIQYWAERADAEDNLQAVAYEFLWSTRPGISTA